MTEHILNAIKILDVYVCLTGHKPKPTNNHCYRCPAVWRAGDGLNVSLDNDRGIWHDFATDDGGGILDLIVRIRGGSRKDALIWAAEFVGIPLETKEFTPEQKAEWLQAKQELERDLLSALHWQRAAINMAEDSLNRLKASLFDPEPADPTDLSLPVPLRGDEIYSMTLMISRLRHLEGVPLVEEYRWWHEQYPATTNAMVHAAVQATTREERALRQYLRHGRSTS